MSRFSLRIWTVLGCALLTVSSAAGQGQKQPVESLQEDCGVTFNFDTASSGAQAAGTTTAGSTGTTAVIDNRQAGCLDWVVAYEPNSATASVSLAFQTALDVAGVPTTWSNYPGTLTTGINPNTAVTTGGARTEASGVQYPFLRINMTVITGAGARIQGKLTGWKRRPPITANAVIVPGTICTAGVPCPVDGPTASGVAPAFPPVLIAGQDGTLTRTVLTDTAGRPRVVGAAADGAAVVGDPVRIGGKDGSGNTQDIATDTAGDVVVVGTKTSNAAAPGANNVGVLPCVANAAAPTWTEGFQVPCSEDLSGNVRVAVTSAPANQSINLAQVGGITVVTGGLAGSQGVGGLAADGAAVVGNPNRIAGKDGSGNTQDIATDTRGDQLIVIDGNPTVLSGQQAVTTGAVALATNTVKNICIKSSRSNTTSVFFGPTGVSTTTGMELSPGDAYCAPVTNTNLIFVISVAGGEAVSWVATN